MNMLFPYDLTILNFLLWLSIFSYVFALRKFLRVMLLTTTVVTDLSDALKTMGTKFLKVTLLSSLLFSSSAIFIIATGVNTNNSTFVYLPYILGLFFVFLIPSWNREFNNAIDNLGVPYRNGRELTTQHPEVRTYFTLMPYTNLQQTYGSIEEYNLANEKLAKLNQSQFTFIHSPLVYPNGDGFDVIQEKITALGIDIQHCLFDIEFPPPDEHRIRD